MIQLNIEKIKDDSQTHLTGKQAAINKEASFSEKVKKAETLWEGKSGSKNGKAAFEDIKKTLINMCVSVEICNYCENNEATDVEHLYPKKLYPERAFSWDNYILACKTCNTTYKSDQFAIFDPTGSENFFEIPRERGVYTQPANDDAAMLNPRTEDPLQYLLLDIAGRTFRFSAYPHISNKDKRRAEYTLELLKLNDRDALVEARRAAANYYLDRLEKYIRVRDANDFDELKIAVNDTDALDESGIFDDEKRRITTAIQNDIQKYAHPTIWAELIRQRPHLNKTQRLFDQAPEALNW